MALTDKKGKLESSVWTDVLWHHSGLLWYLQTHQKVIWGNKTKFRFQPSDIHRNEGPEDPGVVATPATSAQESESEASMGHTARIRPTKVTCQILLQKRRLMDSSVSYQSLRT